MMRPMDNHEAAEAFNERFMEVYQRFYRRVRPTSYRPGPEALAVLRHLHSSGPLTVTEAARHFSRSQASMSELIARMERRDLVGRVADQRDRRNKLVWLTETGMSAYEDSVRVLSVGKLERALGQLTSSERQRTVAVLERLLATEPEHEGWDDG
jgi:DNA-binding MarR family transcriptional regulator